MGGLFSQQYISAPWSWDKVVDMLKHLWIPVLILALNGTAGGLRTTRANLLDELNKPYVETARSKGHHRSQSDLEVPGARGAEPVLQHGGLGAGQPDLGLARWSRSCSACKRPARCCCAR